MAQILYEPGDIVGDAEGQLGVVINSVKVLALMRDGNNYRPELKKTDDFLPLHPAAIVGITQYQRVALLSVIVALSLPNKLTERPIKVNNLRKE